MVRRYIYHNYSIQLTRLTHLPLNRKTPWKLSKPRKYRLRKRLQAVDNVVATLVESGVEMKALVGLDFLVFFVLGWIVNE